jgi:hypothetical protein
MDCNCCGILAKGWKERSGSGEAEIEFRGDRARGGAARRWLLASARLLLWMKGFVGWLMAIGSRFESDRLLERARRGRARARRSPWALSRKTP